MGYASHTTLRTVLVYGDSKIHNLLCSLYHNRVVLNLRYGYPKIPYRILERIIVQSFPCCGTFEVMAKHYSLVTLGTLTSADFSKRVKPTWRFPWVRLRSVNRHPLKLLLANILTMDFTKMCLLIIRK